jgi:GntR family transcriptional regulator, transcriptional repressor for pyruvate dehydrogenase complex
LADRVAAEIQKLISQQDLVPDMKLPSERELCEQFGVSRTVVREAVRMLVSKGLLETRRGKGTLVRRMTSDHLSEPISMMMATQSDRFTVDHIHQVRCILEIATVRLAARQATDEDLAELRVLVGKMQTTDPRGEDFATLDTDFHALLAQNTHNPFLTVLVNASREVMQNIRRRVHDYEGLGQLVTADHARIVDCIAVHDEEGAAQAMSNHLDHAREIQHVMIEDTETKNGG